LDSKFAAKRLRMGLVYRRWTSSGNRFGDLMVLGFLLVQCLDGVFTYLGVKTFGPSVEANPLVSSAIAVAGPALGLAGTKLVAASFGILLHLRGVHLVVGLLTALYFAAAILPWTALFLTN
jgi:hypothetical protein